MSFLTAVFHSNAAIYQSQSTQVIWLMAKLHENDEYSHTVCYIRSIHIAGNRHKLLKKALFLDIRVANDMLQSGLFAPNAQNLAHCRL